MSPLPLGVLGSARYASAVTYAAAVTADSPAMWWRLGDASGTSATDSSGNLRAGTINPTYVTWGAVGLAGDSNTAATLTGATADTRISIPYASWMGSADRTVECIVKPSDVTNVAGSTIIGQADDNLANTWWVEIYNGTLNLFASGNYTSPTVAIAAGVVKHIAYRQTSDLHEVLINGVVVMSKFGANTPVSAFRAGYRGATPAQPLEGVLDEVAYYTTALTDARILAHSQAAGL